MKISIKPMQRDAQCIISYKDARAELYSPLVVSVQNMHHSTRQIQPWSRSRSRQRQSTTTDFSTTKLPNKFKPDSNQFPFSCPVTFAAPWQGASSWEEFPKIEILLWFLFPFSPMSPLLLSFLSLSSHSFLQHLRETLGGIHIFFARS